MAFHVAATPEWTVLVLFESGQADPQPTSIPKFGMLRAERRLLSWLITDSAG